MSDRKDRSEWRGRIVRFPIVSPCMIECPVCEGKGCRICNDGMYEYDGDVYVDVQHHLVCKYIVDNIDFVSMELSKVFGLKPTVRTEEMRETKHGLIEIMRFDSTSGSAWVVDTRDGVKVFYSKEELDLWCE